jgi:Acetylaranotin biosynthesis cluster protein L
MDFEHLVQINDPLLPLLEDLTREQLWRGLVLRAEDPVSFVFGLEDAALLDRTEHEGVTHLTRRLDFGTFTVIDTVRLYPMLRTETDVPATDRWPASRLVIRIEAPQPELLYLRFRYESGHDTSDAALEQATSALHRQAYELADLDTVGRIRQLRDAGRLG